MTLVCPDCFQDVGLQRRIREIRPSFPDAYCEFHPTKKGIPISEVAEIVNQVFRSLYTFGEYDPRYDETIGNDLSGTLYELTEADDERVISSLANALIESDDYWPPDGEGPFYDQERTYVPNEEGFEEHSYTWRQFRHEILHEQRFFNQRALGKLKDIFDGLHLLRDDEDKPALYELASEDPSVEFFRARKANSIEERKRISEDPASELGAPPEKLRRAGRMNSSGILTFYGAMELDTCVAELRPAVGETVIAAKFSLIRPILVLDTTRFIGRPKAVNPFARTYLSRMKLWKFMTTFMHEIARPSLPNDEHLDYIPTQVVSEYLVHIHKFKRSESERTIDAIIYTSAQNSNGKNIAIFGDAGIVKGASSRSSRLFPRGKPALQLIGGSLSSYRITSVHHDKEEAYTPIGMFKKKMPVDDEEF